MKIKVGDGKYEFRLTRGEVDVYRYGECWWIVDEGLKAVICLMRAVEQARNEERAKIVAWLRDTAADEPEYLTRERNVDAGGWNTSADFLDADKIADAIEKGEHDRPSD